MGIALAAGIGAAGSLGGGLLSAFGSSNSAGDAASTNFWTAAMTNAINAKLQREANAQNLDMWKQARGSEGSAILPLYAKSLEKKLNTDLTDMWNSPMLSREDYAKEIARTSGARQGAMDAVNGIYDGSREASMLRNLAPVAAARTRMTRQASMDALAKTLGEIDATQASRGYTGDSFGNRLLKFNANQQQGDAVAGANLQNLIDARTIKDQALQDKLTYAQLPYQVTQNNIDVLRMPEDNFIDTMNRRLQPLSFMKIGTAQPFQFTPVRMSEMPTQMPIAGNSQILGQTAAGVGNTLFNYASQQAQQKQWMDFAKSLQSNNSWNSNVMDLMPSGFNYNPALSGSSDAMSSAWGGNMWDTMSGDIF